MIRVTLSGERATVLPLFIQRLVATIARRNQANLKAINLQTTQSYHPISTPSALPETGYVRLPVVLRIFPVSKSTWWAGIKARKFPAGVKLSERVTAWKVEDIRALIASV